MAELFFFSSEEVSVKLVRSQLITVILHWRDGQMMRSICCSQDKLLEVLPHLFCFSWEEVLLRWLISDSQTIKKALLTVSKVKLFYNFSIYERFHYFDYMWFIDAYINWASHKMTHYWPSIQKPVCDVWLFPECSVWVYTLKGIKGCASVDLDCRYVTTQKKTLWSQFVEKDTAYQPINHILPVWVNSRCSLETWKNMLSKMCYC